MAGYRRARIRARAMPQVRIRVDIEVRVRVRVVVRVIVNVRVRVRALTINEFVFAAALKNSLIVRALRRLRVSQSLIIMTRRGAFLFS